MIILPASASPQNPLLTTKLHIPPPRCSQVFRPRLTARLNQVWEHALTLILAPAGFGKTTLLSEWVQPLLQEQEPQQTTAQKNVPPAKIAWLSLDENDNDPGHFLLYLLAAWQTIQPGLGETGLATRRPQTPQSISNLASGSAEDHEAFLTALINEIAATGSGHKFALILDDYHLINTPAIHHILACLLNYLPPQMRLIIASRAEPPLPLARLRARNQLLELRANDLRFMPAEAATFLNEVMGLELSAVDVAALETRTEGWIAGLQMAALSMRDCQDIPAFMASFTGSQRYIWDYLAEEILQQQPQPVQTFLLQTSILNGLTAPLCDAVLDSPRLAGEKSSQQTLAYLEKANLFIMPLDDHRQWYRYHHLLADFLRDYLQRQVGAPGVAALHRRAAAWYEQNGLAVEAMSHALVAADVERAVRLVEQSGGALLRQSELATLFKWLEALPAELVRARPRLSLFHAWAMVFAGQLAEVETWLQNNQLAPIADEGEIPGELTAIQASVAFFRRNIPQAIELYRLALARLPEENLFLRGAVALSLATACNLHGDIAGAKWAFAQASAISQANHNLPVALIAIGNLAQLHLEQGGLRRAAELYRQALALAARHVERGGPLPPHTGRVHVGLGEVLYQWNDLDAASEHLQEGLQMGQQHGEAITLMKGYLALACLHQARSNPTAAFEAVGQAEAFAQKHQLPSWRVRLNDCRVRLWLAQGDIEAAINCLKQERSGPNDDNARADDSAGYPDELSRLERLTQARLLIAQNKPDEALVLLTSLHQAAAASERTGWVLEISTLQALAYQASGDTPGAVTTLAEALALAEPEGYIRLFVDEGGPLADLLPQVTAPKVAAGYAKKLLTGLQRVNLVESLSDRELEILRLIATGLSNQQIAAELVLTVGTVKWHLSNIYGKLGVNRRTQAVARAREMQLL
ncbi:MAG: tetratricopeptide repeat protein [Anaerolineae bacterium]|nr:tetratricopeptide repeat protein [Anaerolineae bacterium]